MEMRILLKVGGKLKLMWIYEIEFEVCFHKKPHLWMLLRMQEKLMTFLNIPPVLIETDATSNVCFVEMICIPKISISVLN